MGKLEDEEEGDKDYKIATPDVRDIHVVTSREVITAGDQSLTRRRTGQGTDLVRAESITEQGVLVSSRAKDTPYLRVLGHAGTVARNNVRAVTFQINTHELVLDTSGES